MSFKGTVCDNREWQALGGVGTKARWDKETKHQFHLRAARELQSQTALYCLLLLRAVLAGFLNKNHQQNKHTRKHISAFVAPESTDTKEGFFQMGLWVVPATNGLGWFGLVLVQQDDVSELWKYPSII